jgi:hypothetical protein
LVGKSLNEIKEILAEMGLSLGMGDGDEDISVPGKRPNKPLQPTSGARRLPLEDD